LQRQGLCINRKRVLRILKASDLLCRPLKGSIVTTNSLAPLPGLSEPVSESCAVSTGSDLGLGHHLHLVRRRAHLVTALHSALRHRRPPAGLHPSQRSGRAIACHEYTDPFKHYGFAISMSRQGNPYDNAVAESFFKTLKNEEVYLTEYRTAEEAQASIRHFIDQVINQKRLHSSLGYVPPVEYELQYKQTVLIPA
jgi:putative transposase